MKINQDFIYNLIEKDNPFPDICKYMRENIWNYGNDLSEYYNQEEKMNNFEKFILETYEELFSEKLPKYCTGKDTKLSLDNQLLFLDSLSIREAILLKNNLEERGLEVELDYSFSCLPSETVYYKGKVNLDELKKENNFKKVNNLDAENVKGSENIIWSPFPDSLLESMSEGKTENSNLGEVYKKTEKLTLKLLKKINSKNIEIRSDHGYVRHPGAYSFTVPDDISKKIRELMGGQRSCEKDQEIPQALKRYIVEYNGYYMAKSRYVWPISGKYRKNQHGGVSLMECLTPKLIVKK